MNKDNRILYILSGSFSVILLLCCFVQKNNYTNLIVSLASLIFALVFSWLIKKRSILKIQHRQVAFIMGAISVMVISLYYITGAGFGFLKVPIVPVFFLKYALPILISVFASEIIRRVSLAQNQKAADILSFISLSLLDILLLTNNNFLKSFDALVNFCSLAVLPVITANILYHYISRKYGAIPNIAYRFLISVYSYIIPFKPNMPEAMFAFLKILLPLIIILFINTLYEHKKYSVKKRNKSLQIISSSLFIAISIAFIMLISCRFRFGLLVIATDSMTGAIDKGDAIIYEEYKDQTLKEGQIIVFTSETSKKTVHRITNIENLNGELRIYTKGDANESDDNGFRTKSDIIGVSNLKIKYLGYPTVWMRELFNK